MADKKFINQYRGVRLSSIVIDDIQCDPDSVKSMAVVFTIMADDASVGWIDVTGSKVRLTKPELGKLIQGGVVKATQIYMEARDMKDGVNQPVSDYVPYEPEEIEM